MTVSFISRTSLLAIDISAKSRNAGTMQIMSPTVDAITSEAVTSRARNLRELASICSKVEYCMHEEFANTRMVKIQPTLFNFLAGAESET